MNGVELDPVATVEVLNEIGARNAIGRIDLVENRFVGMKSRGCYETPGGTLLLTAHRELEALCLDRELSHFKQHIGLKYAEVVYFGLWFTPLREALQAFVEQLAARRERHGDAWRFTRATSTSPAASRKRRCTGPTSPASPWAPATTRRTPKDFIRILGLPARSRAIIHAKQPESVRSLRSGKKGTASENAAIALTGD